MLVCRGARSMLSLVGMNLRFMLWSMKALLVHSWSGKPLHETKSYAMEDGDVAVTKLLVRLLDLRALALVNVNRTFVHHWAKHAVWYPKHVHVALVVLCS